ncbi:MAG TPA: hypothetical protein VK011_08490 [Acidimicrobiia bacterium]|nr:hypothetical protein [Acidimicrobiia bacterium]
MRDIGIILIVLAVVLFGVNWYIERSRRQRGEQAPPRRGRGAPAPAEEPDFVRPRPTVSEFHVRGNEARVTFDVPFPEEGDEVLADLLVGEAVEVVREKRHTLPIDDVTEVVVFAGRDTPREVGRVSLETPGVLPPPSSFADILNLTSIGADPLSAEFGEEPPSIPETVTPTRSDELEPLGEVIRLPKAVATGLRAQGVDPENMTAAELVTGVLSLFGYTITPGLGEGEYTATKGGTSTFLMADTYRPGDYPEVEESTIRRFIVAFEQSKADRAMLVSEKYAPFMIHETERRDPRIRFVTRERLQKLVDSMALS